MATLSYTITITPNDYDSTVTIVLKIGDRFLESNSFSTITIPQTTDSYKVYKDIKFNSSGINFRVYANKDGMIWNGRTYSNGSLMFSMNNRTSATETVTNSRVYYSIYITTTDGGTYSIPQEYAEKDEKVWLTTIPNTGYHLDKVLSNIDFIDNWHFNFDTDKNNFIMPESEVSIKINFKEIEPYQGKIMLNDTQKYFVYTNGYKCNIYTNGKRFT